MVWMKKPNSEILSILMLFFAAAFRSIPSFSKILSSVQTIRYSSPVVNSIHNEFKNINNANSSMKLGHSDTKPEAINVKSSI
jgi:hypothetical protein